MPSLSAAGISGLLAGEDVKPELFDEAPIGERPPIRWPDGRRLAVWVVPNVEHYELVPSVRGVREAWPRCGPPDGLDYPRKDYGNRVGLDRFLALCDRLAIPCTVSLSLAVPVMYPENFAAMRERGWEFLCHGLYNTHYLWDCPIEAERAFIADCQARMRAATGRPIRGWFSPACSHTVNTPELVAEAGIDYYCDLYHDDQPFPVNTRSGSLITVPYSMDVNDAVLHAAGADGDAFEQVIRDQFDRLYDESRASGRVMCIACHPYLSCQPQRVRAFERALRHVLAHDDIWLTTGAAIADWYRRHHLDEVRAWLAGRAQGRQAPASVSAAAQAKADASGGRMPDGLPVSPPGAVPRAPPAGRLDHDDYAPRASLREASAPWPDGHAAAAFVLVHVEALELDPPAGAVREPRLRGEFGSFHPDLRAHSLFEYGLRLGVFRLLDLLQHHGWQVAAAVNGLVAAEKPALVRALAARGVEVLASGWSASRMVTGAMPAVEEARLLEDTLAAIADATGRRPRGHASQDYGHSRHTAALLAAAGLDHAVDWPNDEKPFGWGPGRRMVMLPAAAELDDVQAMQARRIQPRHWAGALDAALGWWAEAAAPGSVLALPLHAATAGAAHRAQALSRVLQAHQAARFWQASPAMVADAWRRATGSSAPG